MEKNTIPGPSDALSYIDRFDTLDEVRAEIDKAKANPDRETAAYILMKLIERVAGEGPAGESKRKGMIGQPEAADVLRELNNALATSPEVSEIKDIVHAYQVFASQRVESMLKAEKNIEQKKRGVYEGTYGGWVD